MAPSDIAGTSSEPGKAALEAETIKMNLYSDLVREYDMVPVAMETYG